jgi:hypothetical protein
MVIGEQVLISDLCPYMHAIKCIQPQNKEFADKSCNRNGAQLWYQFECKSREVLK